MTSQVLQRDTNTVTIATFYENYLLGKYNFEPPYQRKSVWNEEKQSFFIDSILKNFPIPPIFLHQHIDSSGKSTYDVIDGKQRLSALIRFIKNEISVSNEQAPSDEDSPIAGATFSDLDKLELSGYKKQFWRYAIPIEYIDTSSPDVIDDIFDRLNRNGEPLTGQELRNAKHHGTPFLELVQRLAKTTFWKERLGSVDVSRMEDQEFVSELLFVLLEKGPLGADPRVIDELYEKYTASLTDWKTVEKEFIAVSDFMEKLSLDYDGYSIRGVSHLYGLWCFSWYVNTKSIQPGAVSPALMKFFKELRSTPLSREVAEYKKTMSSNTKSVSMRERRLEALVQFCQAGLPALAMQPKEVLKTA